ncbi:MAG: signal recognition particle-docking protein FtsY [Treponema sp.]|nr:MAG: signal recognition particle-docking protein FtsY [Treponema sp.]
MAKQSFADKLKNLFGVHNKIDEEFFEDLIDSLIEGDIAPKLAIEIEKELRTEYKKGNIKDVSNLPEILTQILSPFVKNCFFAPEPDKVGVYLILGVNGVGKTTSIAKMAKYYKTHYQTNLILAAADTFRAAAIEQLQAHGKNIDVRVISHKHGGDPAAVVFDAGEAMSAQGGGLVLIDTAGRLHNKDNLVRELQKIDRIAKSKADNSLYKKILVLDVTTGQNGMRQAEVFNEAIGVDAIVLTKYDSTAKGGIAITIGKELGIPIMFIGTGEKYEDIEKFNPEKYIKEFIGNK